MHKGQTFFHVLESVYGNLYGYVVIEDISDSRIKYSRHTFKNGSKSVEVHTVDVHLFETFISSPGVFEID